MPSEFDLWTRIVIPITTFLAGVVVTFLSQRFWRKRTVVSESAKALATLTADWYNQLDALGKEWSDAKDEEAPALVDSYLRNRVILPKILYHLTVLRERNACPELISDVERFLSRVTSYGGLSNTRAVRCADVLSSAPAGDFLTTLHELDDYQQAVARQAARVPD